jgi:glycosyltransferase involved in cell wall biosynthesis
MPLSPAPQISIILPAYNAAAFIGRAIASAQAQSLADIEIIVIDDASTDDTPRIVQALAAADPRIRYVRMAQNGGPAASRNRGLDLACGDWVALLDADDRFLPQRLHTLLALAEAEQADMVSDNLLLCAGPEETGEPMIPQARLPAPRQLSFADFIAGCSPDERASRRVSFTFMHPMFRRTFLQAHAIRYNELSRNGEDFLLYVDCLLAGARWFVTPEPMYVYFIREGSLTEMLSRADQRRLIDRARDLSRDPRIRNDPALSAALHRHWRTIAPVYYYYSLKDALLAADPRAAWRLLSSDRLVPGLVLGELARRVPDICRRRANVVAQFLRANP